MNLSSPPPSLPTQPASPHWATQLSCVYTVLSTVQPRNRTGIPTLDSLSLIPSRIPPVGHQVNLLCVSSIYTLRAPPSFCLVRTATAVFKHLCSPCSHLSQMYSLDSLLNKLVKRHIWSYPSTINLSSVSTLYLRESPNFKISLLAWLLFITFLSLASSTKRS